MSVQDRRGGVVDLLQDGRKAWTEQVRDDRSVKLTSQWDEVADNAAGGGPYLSANCMFKVPRGQVMMLTLPPPLMADT